MKTKLALFIIGLAASVGAHAAAVTVQNPGTAGGYDSSGAYRTSSDGSTSGADRAAYTGAQGSSTSGGGSSTTGSDPKRIEIVYDATLDRYCNHTRLGWGGEIRNTFRLLDCGSSSGTQQTGTAFIFTNTNQTNSATLRLLLTMGRASDDTVKLKLLEDGQAGCNWETYSGYTKESDCALSRLVTGNADNFDITVTYLVTIPAATTRAIQITGGVFAGSGGDAYYYDGGTAEVASSPTGTQAVLVPGNSTGTGNTSIGSRTNVDPSTVQTSDTVTVPGNNSTLRVSIIGGGGSYSVNGGAYTTAAGSVRSGDRVVVRHTSSSNYSFTLTSTLTVGAQNYTFSSTTKADPNPPADPCQGANPPKYCTY